MTTLIARSGARFVVALMLLFSFFLLLRGHHAPGGGFVGGLVAGSGFAFLLFAEGVHAARHAVRVHPLTLVGVGLAVAALSGTLAWVQGRPYLTGLWGKVPTTGGALDLGTPLLFDLGVYLLVVGVVTAVLFELAEAT